MQAASAASAAGAGSAAAAATTAATSAAAASSAASTGNAGVSLSVYLTAVKKMVFHCVDLGVNTLDLRYSATCIIILLSDGNESFRYK